VSDLDLAAAQTYGLWIVRGSTASMIVDLSLIADGTPRLKILEKV
jgi:hypothetical protein